MYASVHWMTPQGTYQGSRQATHSTTHQEYQLQECQFNRRSAVWRLVRRLAASELTGSFGAGAENGSTGITPARTTAGLAWYTGATAGLARIDGRRE